MPRPINSLHGNSPRPLHTNKMSFLDYYRLRARIEDHKERPTSEITQHDSDKVTFVDAYHVFNLIEANCMKYTSRVEKIDLDLLSQIIYLLYDKNVASGKEANEIMNGVYSKKHRERTNNNGKKESK